MPAGSQNNKILNHGEHRDHRENLVTQTVIGAAIDVHRELGPGLLETAYRSCLVHELTLRGVKTESERGLPIRYRGVELDVGYRVDIVIEDLVLVEIKAIERLLPIHEAQLLTYLKLSGKHVGLLINFNVKLLTSGIRRLAL